MMPKVTTPTQPASSKRLVANGTSNAPEPTGSINAPHDQERLVLNGRLDRVKHPVDLVLVKGPTHHANLAHVNASCALMRSTVSTAATVMGSTSKFTVADAGAAKRGPGQGFRNEMQMESVVVALPDGQRNP